MKRKLYDIDPANVDADGLCASQTPAAGGSQSLSLDGALITGGVFDVAGANAGESAGIGGRQIAITAVGNESARTFTVTGTDQDGDTQTESITGPNATTTESTVYWNTVTDISVDDDTAGAITVGTVDEVITKTIPINWRSNEAFTCTVLGTTGTIQFDIDETFDDLYETAPISATWLTKSSNQTADVATAMTLHATGVRLKVDSYTDTAELQFHVLGN